MNCRNHVLRSLLTVLFVLVLASSADGATLNVPADFSTIQAAVNAAAAGDTILVQSGTYYENVNVNKALTLQGVYSGSGLPVVDAGGSGDAIILRANNCSLQDFVAMNSSGQSGIRVLSSYNTIYGNTVVGNYYGIAVRSSSIGNTISGNTATDNSRYGILLDSSSGNTISGNTATGNDYGIILSSSSDNTISSNTAACNSNCGIYLRSSSNGNTINGNIATGNQVGIHLNSSSNNTISSNTATNNSQHGIRLTYSSGNTIFGNAAAGNTYYSIYLLSSSDGNTIYLNTLDSGRSNGANNWNSTTEIAYGNTTTYVGNIWSYYNGIDCDGDGIGDTPYPVAGGSDIDYYPIGGVLISPGLEAEKIADRSEAEVGDWINYTVYVNNTGNVNLTDVRAEDNLTGAVWNVGTLAPGQNYIATTSYQVNLSDLPGPLINELQANGTDPCDHGVNDSAIEIVNITSYQLLCISGYKIDYCADGMPGWNITLTNGSCTKSVLTDGTGKYEFCGLVPGDYELIETVPTGWHSGDAPETVMLDYENVTNQNFTNYKLLCISGYKVDECTEMGLESWEIFLKDNNGNEIRRTLTSHDGYYEFCDLEPGDYELSETVPPGWHPGNAPGTVTLDCENAINQNFTNYRLLCISGHKVDECTNDVLPDWEIILTNSSGEVARTTTNATGYYEFCGLSFGNYTVCEVLKAGWKNVTAECMYVELECEDIVVNFENIPTLCISGHEFNHCTGAGLEGWIVHLKDGSGNVLSTTTTDGTGYYEFCGLEPGWYTVCEDSIPEGWTSFRDDPNSLAMATPGTSGAPEDYETPKCIVVNLDYCEDSTDNDFENIPTFCINGTIYNNSTTVANFPVKIENSDASLVLSIPTDEYGDYSFCGLKADTYTVCVDKPGWTADEPCVVVYLDCQDEEHDFDVYEGRSNILPTIEQPAIILDDSRAAIDLGAMSVEPPAAIEQDIGGDEEEGRQPAAPEMA